MVRGLISFLSQAVRIVRTRVLISGESHSNTVCMAFKSLFSESSSGVHEFSPRLASLISISSRVMGVEIFHYLLPFFDHLNALRLLDGASGAT